MIRFDNALWRGVIAEEVTVAAVRRVSAAIARSLHEARSGRRGVFVGYDTRFLSQRFAREAAAVLAAHGIPVQLSPSPAPAPAVAFAVLSGSRAGGINITAGHEPPEYSGLKLSMAGGAAVSPEMTRAIERLANEPPRRPNPAWPARRAPRRSAAVRSRDVRPDYFRQLGTLVRLRAIRKAQLDVACDPRHGAASGYLDGILARACRSVEVLHGTPHPEFGGAGPACGEPQLKPLARAVRRGRLALGLATDAGGSRFGIVDAGGSFISPNLFLALLADYLLVHRRMAGGVARSVATTHLLDAVCALHGRPLFETPVGFRHLSEPLLSGGAFLVGEESGGLSLRGHVPEKDGILAGLLAAEMVAVRRSSLRDQARDLFTRVGPLHGRRIDYHVDAGTRERLLRRLEDVPPTFAGKRTVRCDTTDGSKRVFADGSWILFRIPDGRSLVRCHIEARTTRDIESLTAAAREMITRS